MVRDLVILGAGGHGRELLDVVEAINNQTSRWRFLGFFDDASPPLDRLARRGTSVLGGTADVAHVDADVAIGVGDSHVRERLDALMRADGHQAAVLVHPSATVGSDIELGPGVVLAARACVTTNIRVGRHTHLNVGAIVSHDCRLGDYVTLSPGALMNGTNTLEDHVLLGTGAIVTPGRRIGRDTWVGAGAVVITDLPAACVAVGVPARVTRARAEG